MNRQEWKSAYQALRKSPGKMARIAYFHHRGIQWMAHYDSDDSLRLAPVHLHQRDARRSFWNDWFWCAYYRDIAKTRRVWLGDHWKPSSAKAYRDCIADLRRWNWARYLVKSPA